MLRAGAAAVRTIPGLHRAAFQGFGLNLAIYFLVMALLNYGFYAGIHLPMRHWLESETAPWLNLFVEMTLWFAQLAVLLISALLSIRVSFKLMSYWHGALIALVIRWFRADLPSMGVIQALPGMIRDLVKEVALGIGLLALGFVPFIGAPLVFLIGCALQGASIVEPYESAMREAKQPTGPRQSAATRLLLGAAQMLLALLPVIGWLLLPIVNIYQVVGFAYIQEQRRQTTGGESKPS